MTILAYDLSPVSDHPRGYDPVAYLKGAVNMADYHFRVNAERLSVDPLTVTTKIEWGPGTCRFAVEAPVPAEVLTAAVLPAMQLVGLRAEQRRV